ARAAVRPGVSASQVDAAARRHLAERGYGDRFIHRTGHGIGLDIHELPSIQAGNELPLEEGYTFSLEPGVYLPGRFGVRMEDIVAVTDQGCQTLTGLPHTLHKVAL
ncbi:MAG: M24 family metallopeptidase, partial [Chloroflexi bacterium]|nr:M24 family metallopeptidase [Chloroflexota bacterium]